MKKVFKAISVIFGIALCFWIYVDNKEEGLQPTLDETPVSQLLTQTQNPDTPVSLPLESATKILNNKETVDDENNDKSDYIVECKLNHITDYENLSNADIIASFETSNSQNKQLAYALYSELTGEESRLDRLLKFNQRFPGNPIALEQMLGLCTEVKDHPSCNQELVQQAISVDGQNAAMWFAIASFYASKDDPEKIKHAFRQIISAPLYQESFADYIELYIDSLQGRPNEDFSTNALSALGVVAAQPSFFNIISKLCTEKPEVDEEFSLLCLSLGETMESRGKTNITQMIGSAYQEYIFELEGNDAAVQELEKKRKQNNVPISLFNQATNLALFDQRLFRSWLNNVRNLGEHEAAQLIVEEAITLSKNPFYQPCP